MYGHSHAPVVASSISVMHMNRNRAAICLYIGTSGEEKTYERFSRSIVCGSESSKCSMQKPRHSARTSSLGSQVLQ